MVNNPKCPYCGAPSWKHGLTKGQTDIDDNPVVQQIYRCSKCHSSFRRKVKE